MARRRPHEPAVIPAAAARRLLMAGSGLLADPARRAGPTAVGRTIERMAFVQIDTINIIQRAHHHILLTRLAGYRPAMLARNLEVKRALFEHWTHDASIIPATWLRFWTLRFARYAQRGHSPDSWWAKRMGGDPQPVIDHVIERITDEGPLMSRDFLHEQRNGPWWGWKPQKAALEYLWRIGRLAISRRENFHKVYDLIERVFPQVGELEAPDHEEHVAWACGEAMSRLTVATPAEIAAFFEAVPLADAAAWCRRGVEDGTLIEARVESADGAPARKAYARADWKRRLARCADAPAVMRPLSPFDPVLRDRARARRLFDFDYRFEGFVPAAKRRWGYYVLPLLDGERLVGRLDAKLHRDRGELVVKDLWWEDRCRVTKALRGRLEAALHEFAVGIGAARFILPAASCRA